MSQDGREQVIGLHMAGELVGLDGISTDAHSCDTVALEDSEVCVIPYDRLEDVATAMPVLHNHFHKVMSREIVREHGVMLLLGSMHAEERLAAFLLNLSQRFETRGYSRTEFVLRMTRAEIGSFLGLKLETVSRVLSRFAQDGLIDVNQKHVRIVTRTDCARSSLARPFRPARRRRQLARAVARRARPESRASNSSVRPQRVSVRRFTSNGERSRNTVSALETAPIAQSAKNPSE